MPDRVTLQRDNAPLGARQRRKPSLNSNRPNSTKSPLGRVRFNCRILDSISYDTHSNIHLVFIVRRQVVARKRRNQRNIKAHHDAGHAVVAYMLGLKVQCVSLDADASTTIELPDGDERTILVDLAGPYAQRHFAPLSAWRRPKQLDDLRKAADLIAEMHGTGEVASKYRAYVEARATQMVEQYWPLIEVIAKGLVERQLIPGDEMAEIMFGPFKP